MLMTIVNSSVAIPEYPNRLEYKSIPLSRNGECIRKNEDETFEIGQNVYGGTVIYVNEDRTNLVLKVESDNEFTSLCYNVYYSSFDKEGILRLVEETRICEDTNKEDREAKAIGKAIRFMMGETCIEINQHYKLKGDKNSDFVHYERGLIAKTTKFRIDNQIRYRIKFVHGNCPIIVNKENGFSYQEMHEAMFAEYLLYLKQKEQQNQMNLNKRRPNKNEMNLNSVPIHNLYSRL